jgi:TRAP-type C4-dicarboxylate transport system permease small subunit
MTVVLLRLKTPAKQIFQLITAVICEVMYVLLAVSGGIAMGQFSTATTPGLGLPMPLCYGAFLVSGILMCLFGIEEFVKPIQVLREHGKGEEKA